MLKLAGKRLVGLTQEEMRTQIAEDIQRYPDRVLGDLTVKTVVEVLDGDNMSVETHAIHLPDCSFAGELEFAVLTNSVQAYALISI